MKRYLPLLLILACGSVDAQITVTARAYRIFPQQNTTYYQTRGTSSTSCYGQGNVYGYGNFANLHASSQCNTSYTNPQQIPITWQYADVYNVVETTTERYLIGCRAAWRWTKCSPLQPGDRFVVTTQGNTMIVSAFKNGDQRKEQHIKYAIVEHTPIPSQAAPIQAVPVMSQQVPPSAITSKPSSNYESAGSGSVHISSTPSGAEIEIDGNFVGNTPSTITLSAGSHNVILTMRGYTVWQRQLVISGGAVNLTTTLEQAK